MLPTNQEVYNDNEFATAKHTRPEGHIDLTTLFQSFNPKVITEDKDPSFDKLPSSQIHNIQDSSQIINNTQNVCAPDESSQDDEITQDYSSAKV